MPEHHANVENISEGLYGQDTRTHRGHSREHNLLVPGVRPPRVCVPRSIELMSACPCPCLPKIVFVPALIIHYPLSPFVPPPLGTRI